MSPSRGLRRVENLPWLLVGVTFAVLLVLVGASIANYASVADAHARVALSLTSTAIFRGASANGLLPDNGTLVFTVYFHVDDPTSRSLSFFTIGYRVWAEDGPAEAHLSISRSPADVAVTNSTGSHTYFRALDGSIQTPPYPIPAGTNTTVPYTLYLSRANDSTRFAAIQNITEYAVNVLGSSSRIVWNVWVIVNLDIAGIPSPASFSEAPYFAAISRVQFIEGIDFGLV